MGRGGYVQARRAADGGDVVVSSADVFVARGLRWMVEHQPWSGGPEVRITEAASLSDAVAVTAEIRPRVLVLDMGRTPAQCFAHLPVLVRHSGVVLISRRHDANFAQLARRQGVVEILVYDESSDLHVRRAVRMAAAHASEGREIVSAARRSRSYAWNLGGTLPKLPHLPHRSMESPRGAGVRPGVHAPRLRVVSDPGESLGEAGDVAGVLSRRESEVMDLVAGGQTNRQVAAALGLTEKTVKNHINRIFAKLHVQTRVQAVLAWKSGKR
jgi:DNA-binding NarL/FixJ family response regulator